MVVVSLNYMKFIIMRPERKEQTKERKINPGRNPEDFDLAQLAKRTEGLTQRESTQAEVRNERMFCAGTCTFQPWGPGTGHWSLKRAGECQLRLRIRGGLAWGGMS
jgi:hypothetical protein